MCAENVCFWKHPIVWMKVRWHLRKRRQSVLLHARKAWRMGMEEKNKID